MWNENQFFSLNEGEYVLINKDTIRVKRSQDNFNFQKGG